MLTAEGVLSRARNLGPWHREPDGRIRNQRGLDPYCAVTGSWMPRAEDDWTVGKVIQASDFPNHPFRRTVMLTLEVVG